MCSPDEISVNYGIAVEWAFLRNTEVVQLEVELGY